MSIKIMKRSVIVPVLDSCANAIEFTIVRTRFLKKDLIASLVIPDEHTTQPLYDVFVSPHGLELLRNEDDTKKKHLLPLLKTVWDNLEEAAWKVDKAIGCLSSDGKPSNSNDTGTGNAQDTDDDDVQDDNDDAKAARADEQAALQRKAISIINQDNPYNILTDVEKLLKKLRDYRQQWIEFS